MESILMIPQWFINETAPIQSWIDLAKTAGFTGISLEERLSNYNQTTGKFVFTKFLTNAAAVKNSGLKVLFRAIMEGKATEPWLPQEYFSQKKATLDPVTKQYIVDSWTLNIFYPESKYMQAVLSSSRDKIHAKRDRSENSALRKMQRTACKRKNTDAKRQQRSILLRKMQIQVQSKRRNNKSAKMPVLRKDRQDNPRQKRNIRQPDQ